MLSCLKIEDFFRNRRAAHQRKQFDSGSQHELFWYSWATHWVFCPLPAGVHNDFHTQRGPWLEESLSYVTVLWHFSPAWFLECPPTQLEHRLKFGKCSIYTGSMLHSPRKGCELERPSIESLRWKKVFMKVFSPQRRALLTQLFGKDLHSTREWRGTFFMEINFLFPRRTMKRRHE